MKPDNETAYIKLETVTTAVDKKLTDTVQVISSESVLNL